MRGVEVTGLLRALRWVERQLSSSNNIKLLHHFISGQHQVKERKYSVASCSCSCSFASSSSV